MKLADVIPWTNFFASFFKERIGYNVEQFLPILAEWKIGDISERFEYDFKETVSDQLIFSHYHKDSKFLKLYNADLVSESGGSGPPVWNTRTVDALMALGNGTISGGVFCFESALA